MGRDVSFLLRNGHRFMAQRKRAGMLYDDTGTYWSNESLLVMPFEQGKTEWETSKSRDFYGKDFITYKGRIPQLPPKRLSDGWRNLGEVKKIFYDRAGKYEGPFKHEFDKPTGLWRLIWPFDRRAHGPALLYVRKACFRVEFPEGCIIDDRGIVMP